MSAVLNGWVLPLLIGALTGILSGFGVGGGTLLLVWLTAVAGMDQQAAQGINLLYFLPAAALSLPAHVKNGYIEKKVLLPAIAAGLLCAGAAAWISTGLETRLLRKLFGGFLVFVGISQLFSRPSGENPDGGKSTRS